MIKNFLALVIEVFSKKFNTQYTFEQVIYKYLLFYQIYKTNKMNP